MQLYTLYSKLLFAVIGLLFAGNVFGQDSLTFPSLKCEELKRLEQETTFLNDKIYTGLFVKCNSDSVINVQLFEKGKFKKYLKIREVDSILNLQVKLSWQNLHDDDPSYPKNPSQIKPANISEDGIFKNGLFTGKKYIYDKNGLLDKIEVWKNGKYAGDAQID